MTRALSNAHRVEIVAAPTTVLELAAASLAPGAWVNITSLMNNPLGPINWELVMDRDVEGASENNVQWSSKGAYNPSTKTIRHLGCGHHAGKPEHMVTMFPVEYRIQENRWYGHYGSAFRQAPYVPYPGDFGGMHAYDHQCIDPTNIEYFLKYSETTFKSWNGSSWSTLASAPTPENDTRGMDFDINRNGIWTFDDSLGLRFWNKATNTWPTTVGVYNFPRTPYFPPPMQPFHMAMRYHPPSGIVWMTDGNGSYRHWRLKTDNTVEELTTISPPPFTLGIAGGGGKSLTYDHKSQKLFACDQRPGGQAYLLDIAATVPTWTLLDDCPIGGGDSGWCNGLPAPYNVIWFMRGVSFNTPQVWLYKTPDGV